MSSCLLLRIPGGGLIDANGNPVGGGGCAATATVTVDPLYGTTYKNWNSYLQMANTGAGWTAYNQTTINPCNGATENGYFSCIHGGEKKKVIVTGQTSCTGLTA